MTSWQWVGFLADTSLTGFAGVCDFLAAVGFLESSVKDTLETSRRDGTIQSMPPARASPYPVVRPGFARSHEQRCWVKLLGSAAQHGTVCGVRCTRSGRGQFTGAGWERADALRTRSPCSASLWGGDDKIWGTPRSNYDDVPSGQLI